MVNYLIKFSLFTFAYTDAFASFQAMRTASPSALSTINNLKLRNWGVFDVVDLDLSASSFLLVLTGETGAGKSVLISALEHITRQSENKKSSRDIFSILSNKCSISLIKEDALFAREYDCITKKSIPTVDERKVTAKRFAEMLTNCIRFWSCDSIGLMESESIQQYLDQLGDSTVFENTIETSAAYHDWQNICTELRRLEELERRGEAERETSLLLHYADEVASFGIKATQVFAETLDGVFDAIDHERIGLHPIYRAPDTTRSAAAAAARDSLSALVESIETALSSVNGDGADEAGYPVVTTVTPQRSSTSNKPVRSALANEWGAVSGLSEGVSRLDLRLGWPALLAAESVLTSLATAAAALFQGGPAGTSDTLLSPSGKSGGASLGSSSVSKKSPPLGGTGIVSAAAAAAVGDGVLSGQAAQRRTAAQPQAQPQGPTIGSLSDALNSYAGKLLDMQVRLSEQGLSQSTLSSRLEQAHVAVEQAAKGLLQARQSLAQLQRTAPDWSELFSRVRKIRLEWEALARKHTCSPADLQTRAQQWQDELDEIAGLAEALPDCRRRELEKRRSYARAAARRSVQRVVAATKISDWVNGILPDLEMPDKMIKIEVLPLGIETQLTSSPIATVLKVDGEVNNNFRDSPLKVAAGAPPEGSTADEAPAGLLMDQAVDRLAERLFAELAPLQKQSVINSATVWGSSIDAMDEAAAAAAAAAGGAADRNDAASGEAGHRHLVGGSGWDLVRLRIIERRSLAATAKAAAAAVGAAAGGLSAVDRMAQSSPALELPWEGVNQNVSLSRSPSLSLSSSPLLSRTQQAAASTQSNPGAQKGGRREESGVGRGRSRDASTLSSGERARLLLALETCMLTAAVDGPGLGAPQGSDGGAAAGAGGQQTHQLVVFDEIDAHVGGEAAVAVAKLLRTQGRFRKVIAVTHSPVIAAAADRHLVVSRRDNTQLALSPSKAEASLKTSSQKLSAPSHPSRFNPSSDDPTGSNTEADDVHMLAVEEGENHENQVDHSVAALARVAVVEEVTGERREQEIARMAAGRLAASSGRILAQDLLKYFQEQQ